MSGPTSLDPDGYDFGPCCACRRGAADGVPVRNVVSLDIKGETGKGWGCVQCGLPPDGASAALCDDCVSSNAEIRDVVAGYISEKRRRPLDGLTEPHEHDLAKHHEQEDQDAMTEHDFEPSAKRADICRNCKQPKGAHVMPGGTMTLDDEKRLCRERLEPIVAALIAAGVRPGVVAASLGDQAGGIIKSLVEAHHAKRTGSIH